jgi:hypothetical protein
VAAQVVDSLPSKLKTLSSTLSTTKKKKKKKKKKERKARSTEEYELRKNI